MLLLDVQHSTMLANEVHAYCVPRPDARTSSGQQFTARLCGTCRLNNAHFIQGFKLVVGAKMKDYITLHYNTFSIIFLCQGGRFHFYYTVYSVVLHCVYITYTALHI